ncbi:MAG: M15 family metallopeptidase [Myxococcaceae bacterium]
MPFETHSPPDVKRDRVLPLEGFAFLSRNPNTQGLIVESSVVVDAFISRGWAWGGSWGALQDYQHFEIR